MEIAKIQVSGVKAGLMTNSRSRWEIPAGIIGATLRFVYGADWQGLTKTVVFDCGGITKDVVNAGEVVTIPAEVVVRPERKLLVGVYGVDGEGESATPTLWLEGYVCAAADPSGDVSTDPALPVWAQLESRIRALEERNQVCSIVYNLENVTSDTSAESVSYGSALRVSLTVLDGFTLDQVSVTMGGVEVTEWAYADGTVSIANVTGDVVITASSSAAAEAYVAAEAPVTSGYALNHSGGLTAATDNWLYSGFIPAAPGQVFRYTGDTSAYADYDSVWGYDSAGAAAEVLLGNGSYPDGQTFTIPEGVCAIRCCFYVGGSAAHTLEVRADQKDLAGEVSFTEGI